MADDDPRSLKGKTKGKPDAKSTSRSPTRLRRVDEGWHALERGDMQAAHALAARALAESPKAPDALLLEAACLREEGDSEQAVAVLRRVCKADPDWCTPELWLAELLAMQPENHGRGPGPRGAARWIWPTRRASTLNALALKAGLEAELGESRHEAQAKPCVICRRPRSRSAIRCWRGRSPSCGGGGRSRVGPRSLC